MNEYKTGNSYKPSATALSILSTLYKGGPARWTTLKQTVRKTDAGLAMVLKSLREAGAVVRSECPPDCKVTHDHREGLYEITEVGLDILKRASFIRIGAEEFHAQQRKIIVDLWRRVLQLHVEVLKHVPAGNLGPTREDQLVFIAAVEFEPKGKDKEKVLLLHYVDPHECVIEKANEKDLLGRFILTKPLV